jgi:hypothetical protein
MERKEANGLAAERLQVTRRFLVKGLTSARLLAYGPPRCNMT